jgi:hypothetical protein
MKNRFLMGCVAACLLAFCGDAAVGQAALGDTLGFEFGIGMQGAFSYMEAGVVLPKIAGSLFLSLKARAMSSFTWATFINQQTNESVSFHPVVVGGVLSFGGYSPVVRDFIRMRGSADILLGWSFTPYDSLIYKVGNLIGDNLTFAILGSFGMEIFTSDTLSVSIDAGGGYRSLFGDKKNPYVIASSWLGSGFGTRMGMRFYAPATP